MIAVGFVVLLASALQVPAARGDPAEYEIAAATGSVSTSQAGGHPDLEVGLELGRAATTREMSFSLPPGLLANPQSAVRCGLGQLLSTAIDERSDASGCSVDSQVGIVKFRLLVNDVLAEVLEPIYNMTPPGGGIVARLGLIVHSYPVLVDARLRSESDYGLTLVIEGVTASAKLLSANVTMWGVPADESHDTQRITPYEAIHNGGVPETPSGSRPSGIVPVAFLANPTRCGGPREVDVTATSYAEPELPAAASFSLPPLTGCGLLDFLPEVHIAPDGTQAGAPSGLGVEVRLSPRGFERPHLLAGGNPRTAAVELPEGVSFNPSATAGLGACSEGQIGLIPGSPARFGAGPLPGCPSESRIGEAQIASPLLAEPLHGSLYLATPNANPGGSLIAAYLVARGQGVTLKLPIRFDLDPRTGQVSAAFEELPELPFSELSLQLKDGPRGILRMPLRCGRYATGYALTSWTDSRAIEGASELALDRGCGGGFRPGLSAGGSSDTAGDSSPLLLSLSREDGEENLSALSLTLPPGLTAGFAGVPLCPDALARQGACSAASRVGSASIAAGVGPAPALMPAPGEAAASVHLAGPYKGAPYSLAIVEPVRAGPFDLGTAVVRAAIDIDPETAQGTIRLDPLPQILAGIQIDYRDVRIAIDRPGFIRNPTSCEEMKIEGTADSVAGTVAAVSDRFQVGDCGSLGFKPRLRLRVEGATGRNGHPRLTAVLSPRVGDANLRRASVLLPRGELLDQSHVRDVCAADRFAAGECPSGSIYGHARVWSPLLGESLQGPVYLRASEGKLPNLVADLSGPFRIVLVGRVNAADGRIRVTFGGLPDIPIGRAELTLKGGRMGLLVNSEDLCAAGARARASFAAHNRKLHDSRPRLRGDCG